MKFHILVNMPDNQPIVTFDLGYKSYYFLREHSNQNTITFYKLH